MKQFDTFDSPLDERDHIYHNLNFITNGINDELPEKFIATTYGVKHQGWTNFCAGYAASSLLESYYAMVKGEMNEFSPLWAMRLSKAADKRNDITGTFIRCTVAELCSKGGVEEKFYPMNMDDDYNDNKFPTASTEAFDNAKLHKPKKYAKLTTVKEMKHAIRYNGGCEWGIYIYPSYRDLVGGCFLKPPGYKTSPSNGHAIFCIGYDDTLEQIIENVKYKGFFILQESYGTQSGRNGLIYVPYDYITNNVTGYYSSDKFFREAWSFYDDANVAPDYHDKNIVPEPKNTIIMKLESNEVNVCGTIKKMDTVATAMAGTTMIPFRFLAELFKCTVRYTPETKMVSAYMENRATRIEMTLGNPLITKYRGNEKTELLATYPPVAIAGRTLVPIRAISELFDCKVDYNPITKEIKIVGMF